MRLPDLLEYLIIEDILVEAPARDGWHGRSLWFTWCAPLETDSVDLRIWVRDIAPLYAVIEHSLRQTLIETDDLDLAFKVFGVDARHVQEARELVIAVAEPPASRMYLTPSRDRRD